MNKDWSDIALLEDYLEGKLDSKSMHEVEKQALEDPFVAQALAGLTETRGRAVHSVSILQKQLYERIAQQQDTKKKTVVSWQRLSIAAAAAVMFISVSIMFFMKDKARRDQMASASKKVEVDLAPADSVATGTSVPSAVPGPEVAGEAAKGQDTYASNLKPPKDPQYATAQLRASISTVTDEAASTGNNAKLNATPLATARKMSAARPDSTAAAHSAVTAPANAAAAAQVTTVKQAVASPAGGWGKFDTYITDHNKFSAAGPTGKFVTVSFIIDSEGRTADVKVDKGISPEYDEEAVRLIKEGPKWELPQIAGRVVYTIAF